MTDPDDDDAEIAALVDEVGDRELARALWRAFGPDARVWLDRAIPALGGRTPRRALRSRRGAHEVRSLLAKFPR